MIEPGAAWRRVHLLTVAAVVGAATLGLEVLAARTLAPALGTGPAAWAGLLAVALGALAAGNLLGGRLAGRRSAEAVIAWALPPAGAALVGLSQVYGAAMRWAAELPVVRGCLLAAAITQLVPMVLLGTVCPAVLAAARADSPRGRWGGAVLAAGSAGGIAGALGAGLTLLPGLGIARSYLLAAGVLALAAGPAVILGRRWAAGAAAGAVLAAVGGLWVAVGPGGVIQSPHGQIEVRRGDGGAVLLIDGLPQAGIHGPVEPWAGLRRGYLGELAVPLAGRPRHALVVGLGAGLAYRLLACHGLRCRSVELDPAVAAVAREHFGFDGEVSLADGRAYLERTDAEWDIILLDVCTSDRLPAHLFTAEAMHLMRRRLAPGGVLAVQFIGDDGRWSADLAATVAAAFPHRLLLAGAGEPPVGPRWIFAALHRLPPLGDGQASSAGPPWRAWRPSAGGRIITDDHCPAELDWARTAQSWRKAFSGRD